jgi:RNA polymerase sigma-70 factor (ECF subfamily)
VENPPPSPLPSDHGLPATSTDEDLIAELARGESNAFVGLVERHAASVLAVVERAIGDHHLARDLTQEIWIKVHRGLSGFRPGARFRPWLFSIALNHVRDEQRRVGRHPLQLLEETPAQSLPARQTDPRQASEEREAIEAALDRVPEPFRSALHLVDVVGLDYEEAARSLECAVGTVKSRVNRGRFAFRDAWLARGTPSEYRASIRKRRVEP